jgi:hypothetical protein
MRPFATRLSVPLALISIFALADRAAASRPHSASGTAQFVSPTEFVGSGQATHLGRYTEAGQVSFSPTSDPNVLHVDAAVVYTAADGDELHANIAGTLNTHTGVISATVTYVDGGSGRFASASGSATLAGQLGPGGAISVSVAGSIDY